MADNVANLLADSDDELIKSESQPAIKDNNDANESIAASSEAGDNFPEIPMTNMANNDAADSIDEAGTDSVGPTAGKPTSAMKRPSPAPSPLPPPVKPPSVQPSRRASVISNASSTGYHAPSDLSTFLTMGLDTVIDLDNVQVTPPGTRYASAAAKRPTTTPGAAAGATGPAISGSGAAGAPRTSTTTAPQQIEAERSTKTTQAVYATMTDMMDPNRLAGFEPLPPFSEIDLASVIDQVLARIAAENDISVQDVAGSYRKPDVVGGKIIEKSGIGATASTSTDPKEIEREMKKTIAGLNIKLKTSSAIVTELGKKLDKAQRSVAEMTSKLAGFEMDRAAQMSLIERYKKQIASLELRAASAEAAINAYTRKHYSRVKIAGAVDGEGGDDADGEGYDADGRRDQSGSRSGKVRRNVRVVVPLAAMEGEERQKRGRGRGKGKRRGGDHDDMSSDGWDTADGFTSESDTEVYRDYVPDAEELKAAPTQITRAVIEKTARVLAAKKKFDPPSALEIGLQALIDKEEQQGANPNSPRHIQKAPYTMSATSFRPSNTVPRLAHQAHDRIHHLSTVLSNQTHELLAAPTPEAYIRVLHGQLKDMTSALHECIDALAEERRAREKLKLRWEKTCLKLRAEIERRHRLCDDKIVALRRRRSIISALSPLNVGSLENGGVNSIRNSHSIPGGFDGIEVSGAAGSTLVMSSNYVTVIRGASSSLRKRHRRLHAYSAPEHRFRVHQTMLPSSALKRDSHARPITANRPRYQEDSTISKSNYNMPEIPKPASARPVSSSSIGSSSITGGATSQSSDPSTFNKQLQVVVPMPRFDDEFPSPHLAQRPATSPAGTLGDELIYQPDNGQPNIDHRHLTASAKVNGRYRYKGVLPKVSAIGPFRDTVTPARKTLGRAATAGANVTSRVLGHVGNPSYTTASVPAGSHSSSLHWTSSFSTTAPYAIATDTLLAVEEEYVRTMATDTSGKVFLSARQYLEKLHLN
ncbi:hypothetical protein HDU76_001486 [Blyttiomyces sp. JEL0837]|nr:hypothetical protein HDU76_001486 [Blyttiomyces sp. JEL0837]